MSQRMLPLTPEGAAGYIPPAMTAAEKEKIFGLSRRVEKKAPESLAQYCEDMRGTFGDVSAFHVPELRLVKEMERVVQGNTSTPIPRHPISNPPPQNKKVDESSSSSSFLTCPPLTPRAQTETMPGASKPCQTSMSKPPPHDPPGSVGRTRTTGRRKRPSR